MDLDSERAIAAIVRSFLGMKDTVRVSYDELLPLARKAFEAGESQGAKDTLPTAF